MASAARSNVDVDALIRSVKTSRLLNRHLQEICAYERLAKSGSKADLQNRIVTKINLLNSTNDQDKLQLLKRAIDDPTLIQDGNFMGPIVGQRTPSGASAATASFGAQRSSGVTMPNNGAQRFGLLMKESPFYTEQTQIGPTAVCDIMQSHRHTAKVSLSSATYPILTQVPKDSNLRVMVFCAVEGVGLQDVAFPYQCELKVNGFEVKANLRGLKNKPGSTRPVDITKELRFNPPSYNNTIELTYALTSKKFLLAVKVMRTTPVEDLVKKIAEGKRITEKTVIDDMLNKARDADIVATASVLSLKCPLSTLRMSLPCRSTACKHTQCFDGTSYLQLQEQGPTWQCPVCNNPAPFDTLAVDEYVKNILERTSRSTNQVTIHPNGKWEFHNQKETRPAPHMKNEGADSDSDDEILEITKSGETVRLPTPRLSTQSRPSPASSLLRQVSQNAGSVSGKRPISAITIDLTSSGDEDEPAPPPKRHFSYSNGSGNFQGFRNSPAT